MAATPDSIPVDPHIVPWSYRGSFICLATKSGTNGRLTPGHDVYLIHHVYPGGVPLFVLRPVLDHHSLSPPNGFPRTPSPFPFDATPSRLTWTLKADPVVEATFFDARTIRLRGTVPLCFEVDGDLAIYPWQTWLFHVPSPRTSSTSSSHGPAQVEFVSRPEVALRFVALSGRLSLDNAAPSPGPHRRITIASSSDHPTWELLIIEREQGPETCGTASNYRGRLIDEQVQLASRLSFDDTRARMRSLFTEYANSLCPWTARTSTDYYASYVMWTSTVRPAGYFKREAVLMSKLWMNKVWSWDNCFNCLALVPASVHLALDQMLVPFDYISPEGRLPDSMCHSEILYDYTKPPIYGWTIFKLLGMLPSPASEAGSTSSSLFDRLPEDTLRLLYHSIGRFTRFWYEHRSTSVSKIPYYTHGNDSGWDNSTAYDDQTICVSPDLAAFLIIQDDLLAKLAEHLGMENEQKWWAGKRDETATALIDELWDGVFQFKDAFSGHTWTSPTLLKYVPLVAATYLPRHVVESMVAGLSAHRTEWGLATEEPTSARYESDGYWRGPIWAPPTILIESGLRQAGYIELANSIAADYVKLCEKTGFAENYDAVTGAGNRDLSYTWSASTYLVLRAEAEGRKASGGF